MIAWLFPALCVAMGLGILIGIAIERNFQWRRG